MIKRGKDRSIDFMYFELSFMYFELSFRHKLQELEIIVFNK